MRARKEPAGRNPSAYTTKRKTDKERITTARSDGASRFARCLQKGAGDDASLPVIIFATDRCLRLCVRPEGGKGHLGTFGGPRRVAS